jgi:AI-2 transport protein TqsA
MNIPLANYFFLLFSFVLTGYILVIGQSILIPFVIAVFFWYLIKALAHKIRQGTKMPYWLASGLSVFLIVTALVKLVDLVGNNIQLFIRQVAGSQEKYQSALSSVVERYEVLQIDSIQNMIASFDFGSLAGAIIGALGNIATMSVTIVLYVVFLFLEQKTFTWKLKALIKNAQKRKKIEKTLKQIGQSIESYVGLKTVVSIGMGLVGYVVLTIFGIQSAVFWGLIIAVLNFIPYIGTVLAFILPGLATLAQTGDISQTAVIVALLAINAAVTGNVIEPKVFSESLNLSPIVLLLSLAVWGSLWGVLGMILCIPLMVGIMIVLGQFDKTKPIAILMAERE